MPMEDRRVLCAADVKLPHFELNCLGSRVNSSGH